MNLRGMVHSQSLRHETRLARGSSSAVLEAPAFVAGLDDVAVIREAIERGGGYHDVTENTEHRSAKARLVVTMIDSLPLVEPAYQVEQQLAARLGERQIAEFGRTPADETPVSNTSASLPATRRQPQPPDG